MFEYKIKIRFHEVDSAGIMFFGNIFKLAHDAFEEFINSLSLEMSYFNDSEIVTPIIHTEADFKLPMKSGDEIAISIHVSALKNSSFEIAYYFTGKDKNQHAVAKTVHVAVLKNSMEKVLLPVELKTKLTIHKISG